MATSSPWRFRARKLPPFAVAVFIGAAGVMYLASSRPSSLRDARTSSPNGHKTGQEVTNTLSFPKNMLFAQNLIVSKVEQVNHDTKKITFTLPGGDGEVCGVPDGGAILTQHTPAGRLFPVLRPYSPISDSDERGVLQLLVKRYPNGVASTHMHSLRPGQELIVRGPLPIGYSWTPSTTARDVLFIAGGAGITPIYSLMKSIVRNPDDKSRIALIWGVNGTREIVLKHELESLEKQYPDRLQVTYCISGSESTELSDDNQDAKYKKGYIDRGVLQEVINRFDTGTWGDMKGKKVLLCGPPAMEDAIAGRSGILSNLGVDRSNVHRF